MTCRRWELRFFGLALVGLGVACGPELGDSESGSGSGSSATATESDSTTSGGETSAGETSAGDVTGSESSGSSTGGAVDCPQDAVDECFMQSELPVHDCRLEMGCQSGSPETCEEFICLARCEVVWLDAMVECYQELCGDSIDVAQYECRQECMVELAQCQESSMCTDDCSGMADSCANAC